MIKNLVVDCTDMKWGVSAGISRVHVRPVEQQVLKVLHHPVSTDLGSIDWDIEDYVISFLVMAIDNDDDSVFMLKA